jgi:hypothetical protein
VTISVRLPVVSYGLAGSEWRSLGIRQYGQANVGSVDGCNEHLAAELRRLGGSHVGIVDCEGDMPVRLLVS